MAAEDGMSSGEVAALVLGGVVLAVGVGALVMGSKSDDGATLALQRAQLQLEAERARRQGQANGGGGGVLNDVVNAVPGIIKIGSSIKDLLG